MNSMYTTPHKRPVETLDDADVRFLVDTLTLAANETQRIIDDYYGLKVQPPIINELRRYVERALELRAKLEE